MKRMKVTPEEFDRCVEGMVEADKEREEQQGVDNLTK